MKRSLAAMAAAAMLAASVPTLGFADDDMSDDSSSTSSSSSSESSSSEESSSSSSDRRGNEWMRPCDELKGLRKAQCITQHNPGKKKRKDRVQRTNEAKVLRRASQCDDMAGRSKVACIRRQEKAVQKAVKKVIRRTIRGKVIETSSSSASN